MSNYLIVAAGLLVVMGFVHSILGEILIVTPLSRMDVPRLLGTDRHTKRTLRAGWHLTSIGWWGAAATLIATSGQFHRSDIVGIVAVVFLASGVLTLIVTRGVVLSWAVFLGVGALCWMSR